MPHHLLPRAQRLHLRQIEEDANDRIDEVWEKNANRVVDYQVTEALMRVQRKLQDANGGPIKNYSSVAGSKVENRTETTKPYNVPLTAFGIHPMTTEMRADCDEFVSDSDRVFCSHIQHVQSSIFLKRSKKEGERNALVLNDSKEEITWVKTKKQHCTYSYSSIKEVTLHKCRAFWYFRIQFKTNGNKLGKRSNSEWCFKSIRKWLAFDADHGRTVGIQWVCALRIRSAKFRERFFSNPHNLDLLRIVRVQHWLRGVILHKGYLKQQSKRSTLKRYRVQSVLSYMRPVYAILIRPVIVISCGLVHDCLRAWSSVILVRLNQRKVLFTGSMTLRHIEEEEKIAFASTGAGFTEKHLDGNSVHSQIRVFSNILGVQEMKWGYFWRQSASEALGSLLIVLCLDLFTPITLMLQGVHSVLLSIVAQAMVHFLMAISLGSIGGGHFNPLVTVATLFSGDTPLARAVLYLIAQSSGVYIGSVFVPMLTSIHNTVAVMQCVIHVGHTELHAIRSCVKEFIADGFATAPMSYSLPQQVLKALNSPGHGEITYVESEEQVEFSQQAISVQHSHAIAAVASTIYVLVALFIVLKPGARSKSSLLGISVLHAILGTLCSLVHFADTLGGEATEGSSLSMYHLDPFIHLTERGGWSRSDSDHSEYVEKIKYLFGTCVAAAVSGVIHLAIAPRLDNSGS